MPQVDPKPSEEVLQERRKPQFIVEPKEISNQDNLRARSWAAEIMQKHEDKLNTNHFKNREIVTSGTIPPEAIDIRSLYPFPELHWIIYRNDRMKQVMWSVMLLSQHRCLFVSTFATI